MSSTGADDLLDLERGIPTTERDVEALRRDRPGKMSFLEYVRFLESRPRLSIEKLRARAGPRGEPFRL